MVNEFYAFFVLVEVAPVAVPSSRGRALGGRGSHPRASGQEAAARGGSAISAACSIVPLWGARSHRTRAASSRGSTPMCCNRAPGHQRAAAPACGDHHGSPRAGAQPTAVPGESRDRRRCRVPAARSPENGRGSPTRDLPPDEGRCGRPGAGRRLGAAVRCHGEHSGAQARTVGGVDPQSDLPAPLRGVVEEVVRDGRLAGDRGPCREVRKPPRRFLKRRTLARRRSSTSARSRRTSRRPAHCRTADRIRAGQDQSRRCRDSGAR